ncbi:MAG: BsaWI family type II restriction enzyme [Helicobacteraceae bacterium]|jgi:type II restriction enzyme|nr:BsaWI family type II restriction enzyme [Helicobacteraceae bacterium]
MNIKDIIALYNAKKELYGKETYRHVSAIMQEAKAQHKSEFIGDDHEQSWRAFKGKNLEKLIQHIIEDEINSLGLTIINGNSLERINPQNLSRELEIVKRNLLIDYHEFGMHLPDVDIIIYSPKTYQVLAVLSSKVTLRERIAQTGYWKLKLASSSITKHIKVYFVTPDEDGTLISRSKPKKGRAIVETDLDGSYVLTEAKIEESEKVKTFDKLIDDLQKLLIKSA